MSCALRKTRRPKRLDDLGERERQPTADPPLSLRRTLTIRSMTGDSRFRPRWPRGLSRASACTVARADAGDCSPHRAMPRARVAVPLLAQQPPRPQILSRLTWFDRAGTRLGGIGPVADHGNLELSPDGTRVAVAVTDHAHETRDIWIYDAKTGDRTRFTSEPADENWLIWSGDGQRVVLNSFGTRASRSVRGRRPAASSRTRC